MNPTVLAIRNSHERDKNIQFEEKEHIYTVLGERGTYKSVTTFIHSLFPHFDANASINKILSSPKMTDPKYKYYGMTKKMIEDMWEKNRVEAASAGTKMHFDIECYYNELEVVNASVEFQYFMDFVKEFPWLKAYRTEWTVYHEELKISGSIDMVFRDERDGKFYIYDWKRSKEIKFDDNWCDYGVVDCIKHLPNLNFWHYSMQLGVYKAILEEKYGMQISGMFLIVLHPENKKYQRIETADLSKEIKTLFDIRRDLVSKIVKANNSSEMVSPKIDVVSKPKRGRKKKE